jgi:hypothetical protein
MKLIYLIILMFFINGCSNNKSAYWCGDHECIDKREKSEYFKKHMVIEVKNLEKNQIKMTEYEKILAQSQENKKKLFTVNNDLTKINKKEEKFRNKEKKKIAKDLRKKEKKRIKNERKLVKINNKENKKKKPLKIKKIVKNKILKAEQTLKKNIDNLSSFSDLVKEVKERNYNKPFPDINDIPF